ncbi:hypothetical protein F8M41_026552 [Gigaspora margarita]|uniref:Uncharacterized protein n=1 Tax=Gigaspora margarita TaxID=4874 RepID=A0A8H4AB36_GIGMA|nr:hypothetical protein F8M41_026552 [Gigaspora margarita]
MAQVIFNGLKNQQKIGIRHIIFQKNNSQTSPFSFSDGVLNIYSNSEKLKSELDLASFPNLRKITFQGSTQFSILESIDLSKNEKLSKIMIQNNSQKQFFYNNDFILLIKEMQSNQIVLSYYESTSNNMWIEKYKSLREQAIIPYLLVKDKKLAQLEAEIAELRQSLNHKEQTIANLNKKIQRTPTELYFNKLKKLIPIFKSKELPLNN